MTKAITLSETAQEVFELCREQGPLSLSQIAVETLEDLDAVKAAVADLKAQGVLVERPDGTQTVDDPVVGLPTAFRL